MPRNAEWSNANEFRAWPLDESATRISDAGEMLPMGILSGAKILFPDTVGNYAYVGAVSVTDKLVTVIVMASSTLGTAGEPILSISELLPIRRGIPYRMDVIRPGASGWITFGETTAQTFRGTFSLPSQGLLTAPAARRYAAPPVSSFGKYRQLGLRGLVRLKAGNDVKITHQCYAMTPPAISSPNYCTAQSVVTGQVDTGTDSPAGRMILFVSLKDGPAEDPGQILRKYAGDCGKRPDSRTCGDPQPVESFGGVFPDCCGIVTVAVRGCAELLAIQSQVTVDDMGDPIMSEDVSGVLLECPVTMEELCMPEENVPDENDDVPGTIEPLCDPPIDA